MYNESPFPDLFRNRKKNLPRVDDYNRLQNTLRRIAYQGGPHLQSDGAGVRDRQVSWSPILARITGQGSYIIPSGTSEPDQTVTYYLWEQVYSKDDGTTDENSWHMSSSLDAYNNTVYPAFELNGSPDVATGTIVQLLPGDGDFMVFTNPVGFRPLVWYTNYLHIENLQSAIKPGRVILSQEYIGDIASKVNAGDFGGVAHLHWALGDGVDYLYISGNFVSNVGQTVDLASFFNTTYSIPIGSDHDPSSPPPHDLHLSPAQLTEIKARLLPPIDRVAFPTCQIWQSSLTHYGYEYYALDWSSGPSDDDTGGTSSNADAGQKVYNTLLSDDVLTTVVHVNNLDNDTNPAGARQGWHVVLRHELISTQVTHDIPFVGIWTRPHAGYANLLGYASHLQFDQDYPITMVGSMAQIGPVSASGTTLIVQDVDTSPSYSCTTLQFDQADGFQITQPSAGVVRIDYTRGLEIKEADGSPDITNVSLVSLDQTAGFLLDSPGFGQANISIRPASTSQNGIVTTSSQNFAGTKSFFGDVYTFAGLGWDRQSSLVTPYLANDSYFFDPGFLHRGCITWSQISTYAIITGAQYTRYPGAGSDIRLILRTQGRPNDAEFHVIPGSGVRLVTAFQNGSYEVGGGGDDTGYLRGGWANVAVSPGTIISFAAGLYISSSSGGGVGGVGPGGGGFGNNLLRAPTPGPGGLSLNQAPAAWFNVARFDYSSIPATGTQFEFYSQPPGMNNDAFVVEILKPFAKTLPGSITLDLGTAGNPTGYITAFDLTQAQGSFTGGNPASFALGLNSLTAWTSLKARVNYTTGTLTQGEFKIHTRQAVVTDSAYWAQRPTIAREPSYSLPPAVFDGRVIQSRTPAL